MVQRIPEYWRYIGQVLATFSALLCGLQGVFVVLCGIKEWINTVYRLAAWPGLMANSRTRYKPGLQVPGT
ncbi:hypothetical protein I7I48_03397 [Histoplasma ohiense]|nr:hypothetical protein I7I48_03397 [Histoplasma ohiense (nom. inval.)]